MGDSSLQDPPIGESDLQRNQMRQETEALRLASERFDTALRVSKTVVFNQDLDLRCTWIYNPALGYQSPDVIGKRDGDLFERPEDAAVTETMKLEVIRSGKGQRREVLIVNEGIHRFYDLQVDPWLDAEGKIIGVTCAAIDTTERKQFEGALLKSEERFRKIFENAVIGIAIGDLAGRLLHCNTAFSSMLGYDPAELENQSIWSLVHPDDCANNFEAFQRLMTGEIKHYCLENRYCRRDGDTIWAQKYCSLLHDYAGGPTFVVLVASEVTERRNTERALRASEERLRLAQQVARIGTFEWNIQTNVNQWSPELEALYGLAPGGFEGTYQAWATRVHPDDLRRAEAHLRESLVTGLFETEWRAIWPDGSIRWMAARGHIFKNEEGSPQRMVGINLDITDQKRAQESLQFQEELLRKTERLAAAGQLASSMAHEINNPLAAVTNLLYLLERHYQVGDEARDFVSTAASEIARVSRIVKQSLSYYRVGTTPRSVNLGYVVDESLQILQGKFAQARIEVKRDIQENAYLFGFVDELRQIIDNLILNSIDAMPGGGILRVSVQNSSDWKDRARRGARLTIADSGHGISKTHLARVFQPFFSTKLDKGTGLGMWVVHGLVAKHEGTIQLRSSQHIPRNGTTLSIFFPAKVRA